MQRLFHSFIKNWKVRKDRSVLLNRREKNAKIVPFFYKELKRTQRSFRSFEKNGCPNLQKLQYLFLLQRSRQQPWSCSINTCCCVTVSCWALGIGGRCKGLHSVLALDHCTVSCCSALALALHYSQHTVCRWPDLWPVPATAVPMLSALSRWPYLWHCQLLQCPCCLL